MPKERIAHKVEVVDLVAVIFKDLVNLALDNLRFKNSFLETDSICEVHLAVIQEVMSSNKMSNGFFHLINVQIIFWKKVFIRSFCTPVPGIEIISDFLQSNYSDVIREDGIEH